MFFHYHLLHFLPHHNPSLQMLFHSHKTPKTPKTTSHLNPNAEPFYGSAAKPALKLPHQLLPPPVDSETDKVVKKLCGLKEAVVVQKWVPKKCNNVEVDDHEIETRKEIKTTVMIKNIPNKFLRRELLVMLDAHCRAVNEKAKADGDGFIKSQYDFVYLPIDFQKRANKGYAFVNMTSGDGAVRLCKAFQNLKWNAHKSKKICEVSVAKIQGRDALTRRFSKTVFQCDTDEYLPVVFWPPRDGSAAGKATQPKLVGRRMLA